MNKRFFILVGTVAIIALLAITVSIFAANRVEKNEKIATNVSITVRPASWTKNCTKKLTIYGELEKRRPSGPLPNKIVVIQRKIVAGWIPFAIKRTDSEGKYSFKTPVIEQIEVKFRAIFPGDRRYSGSRDEDSTRWSGNPPCPESD